MCVCVCVYVYIYIYMTSSILVSDTASLPGEESSCTSVGVPWDRRLHPFGTWPRFGEIETEANRKPMENQWKTHGKPMETNR